MKAQAPRAAWEAEGEEKRAAVRRLFADIAPTYDLLNGVMSLSRHRPWRRFALRGLALRPGDRALDVCCGTGDFMVELRRAVGAEGRVVGVDFCLPMLDIARRKNAGELVIGDACALPFRDKSFDAVTVGWGLRNVPDIDAAHREIARVLKPGGRFVSLDMAHPRGRFARWVSDLFFHKGVPVLGTLFGKREGYTYLPLSIDRFLSREELAASMELAGLAEVRTRDLMFGSLCIHWGRKP
ncbi:MAG: bifunctional demethylmenaquinone methyltransferase/2-methoxy-6-polyprenyl-1,4-benzoquinol methylase UbiE [Fimbriimonas ginsengisoli]|uniref:Demethylmenaquinone methyltransferase n=1 Tax=Fimbriimonas ginsengisoli TaxID=1005039 RepID=A0A931PU00_FIMGI|nr:bifunctional demethylmenaquinone methyltransferase/2-methoxy-6-polyprenyl-1,4-benzoquinol methylase UbiE [Fimbriimonas ginsengisoli]